MAGKMLTLRHGVCCSDAGGDARANGVPFDEGRTQPWKEGWISADINVGLAGIED
jgi:hypothetical protein